MGYEEYYDDYDYDTGASSLRRILVAFVIGGLVSSLVTLFMAPTSGPQARRAVRKTVEEVKNRAGQAKEAIGSTGSRMRGMVEDAPHMAKSKVEDASKTAKRRASKLKDVAGNVIEEQKDILKRGTEEAADVLKSG